MVDDGFLIGFEDSSGNFVEVGRFNNTADDVTQPLEIKHQNSGERITLDGSGFEARFINDGRLYAGAFPGADPDTRLDNAIASANPGDQITLENKKYSIDRTVAANNSIDVRGLSLTGYARGSQKGTTIDADWDISSGEMLIANVNIPGGSTVTISNGFTSVRATRCLGDIILAGDNSIVFHISGGGNITFNTGTSGGVVGLTVGSISVTDKGSNKVL
jgi:hypothetical protein